MVIIVMAEKNIIYAKSDPSISRPGWQFESEWWDGMVAKFHIGCSSSP